ncbi:MAG: ABC transporter ATP-binding protein [Ferruginibacter sp.]
MVAHLDRPLLQVKNLSISFQQDGGSTSVANNISFDIHPGTLMAIVGESGSGKSVTALSILKLLPPTAQIDGSILFNNSGMEINILSLKNEGIRKLRGNRIAMIFQEPMTSLNPVLTCGEQVMESLQLHMGLTKKQAKQKTIQLFESVELPDPSAMLLRYPHQISGGQKQRVMIAMAMSCDPVLLIADEPTTALDVRVQKNILQLLKKIQEKQQMAILFITHDLALVNTFADKIIVMHKGNIVEQGKSSEVLQSPTHPYTKALLACRPSKNSKLKILPVVADFLNDGHSLHLDESLQQLPLKKPAVSEKKVLEVKHLNVLFAAGKNRWGITNKYFKAVDDVNFSVYENEMVGLVGESGCGKTTLGRTILQLVKPHSGQIILNDRPIEDLPAKELRAIRKDLQIIFQDPYGSLNPRISIGEAITEPMKVHRMGSSFRDRKEKAIHLLEQVSMNANLFNRYPHQFSGGQRQRICIARALALEPSFLIFDESVSALDVSVQAQVLNLIQELKNKYQFTGIFISHDLSVVHYISDRIMVMNQGKIIETGIADDILHRPQELYTQQLIAAMPS